MRICFIPEYHLATVDEKCHGHGSYVNPNCINRIATAYDTS